MPRTVLHLKELLLVEILCCAYIIDIQKIAKYEHPNLYTSSER